MTLRWIGQWRQRAGASASLGADGGGWGGDVSIADIMLDGIVEEGRVLGDYANGFTQGF